MLKFSTLTAEEQSAILHQCASLIRAREPEQVYMQTWRSACGTNACLAGWIAQDCDLSKVFGIAFRSHRSHPVHTEFAPYPEDLTISTYDILDTRGLSRMLFSPASPEELNYFRSYKDVALARLALADMAVTEPQLAFLKGYFSEVAPEDCEGEYEAGDEMGYEGAMLLRKFMGDNLDPIRAHMVKMQGAQKLRISAPE